jgi:hypothetical protein
MTHPQRVKISLLVLRVTVFIVFFMWTIDKLMRPEHASKVYENFYFISLSGVTIFYVIGGLQMLLNFAFLAGWQKRFTYGAMLLFHGVSTFSSYKQYLAPFEGPHLLFFTAWPMLGACLALYLLRHDDTLLSLS